MAKTYVAVHFAGTEAPDADLPEPEPVERRWTGRVDSPDAARQEWSRRYGQQSGQLQPWSADQIGMEHLLIFRVPASPLDIGGVIDLALRRGAPVAYAEVSGSTPR